MKNYYVILGIPSDATQKQIQSAYRKRAKELHPDYFGKDSKPFRQLQKAYSVLADPSRKRAYDSKLKGKAARQVHIEVRHRPASHRRSPIEPMAQRQSSPIQEITNRIQGSFFEELGPERERARSLNIFIPLTPEQARRGGQLHLRLPVLRNCPICQGHGGIGPFKCSTCMGNGNVETETSIPISYHPGTRDNHAVVIHPNHIGIENLYLTVRFKIGNAI